MARADKAPAPAEASARPPLPPPSRPGPAAAAAGTLSAGSFHAGAPIPALASPPRRAPTHRYQTFPTKPPRAPVSRHRRHRSSGSRSASSSASPPPLPPPASHHAPLAASKSATSSSDGNDGNDGNDDEDDEDDEDNDDDDDDDASHHHQTPLPVRQLLLLAFLSLAEQTALNSISPYLPGMVSSMPGVPPGQTGLYVGILASAFALAQLSTNLFWGWASDLVGRKPVLLAGTTSLAACFVVFGLCRRYWHVVVVHVAMGLLNGNAACVPTVLGEVTDRSNQGRAFTYLPVIYSLGSITGPALGGLLVGRIAAPQYPYLAPNLAAAALLAVSVAVLAIWFRETLDQTGVGPWKPRWAARLSSWLRRPRRPRLNRNSWSSRWPRGHADDRRPLLSPPSPSPSADQDGDDDGPPVRAARAARVDGDPLDKPGPDDPESAWRGLANRTTLTLLATYLIFQLSNISFNSLYPIFASADPPTGLQLGPGNIGVSLSLAGLATIIFQAFFYQPLQVRIGNLGTYRFALLGIAASMVLMPWVGYVDDAPLFGIGSGRLWLYAELGLVLVLKSTCAVGGLSSVMLLITNSAPSHASLGTLNGVAQTLSALGRSFGPFVSGGLFTLSIDVRPKGEALAWSVFGGLALAGWLGSMFIRGRGLESDDWEGGQDSDSDAPDRRGSV